MIHPGRIWTSLALLAVPLLACDLHAAPFFFQQTNLVSSVNGLAAVTDPNLKNPWGISFSASSPFWVSNQVTHTATIYNGVGQPNALVVTIPTTGAGGPTGQIFNTTADFALGIGGSATFLFANLDGTISGWNPSHNTLAEIKVSNAGASYTGLASGNNGSGNFLYAANSAGARIDVFDATFAPTSLTGAFTDPSLPSGFTPYNIQNLSGTLYVTYENASTGGGVVDAFDLNGNLLRRVTANGNSGPLKDPWGVTLAPAGFGQFAGALLVGNEADGHISAFNPTTGQFLGQLLDSDSQPVANSGLWGLTFGNGGNGGDPNVLYFAAGIQNETEGLLGAIHGVEIPEPASLLLISAGMGALLHRARRRGLPVT